MFSKWFKVLSGIPQRSVLGPLLFIIYINDLAEACEGHMLVPSYLQTTPRFFSTSIKSQVNKHNLQQTCDIMGTWSDRWLMPLNAKKCTILRIGKDNKGVDNNCCIKVGEVTTNLAKATSIRDLGVILDENLNFKEHINSKIKKAYSILGIIKRNFRQMASNTFIKLYKTMVRSHLDYAVRVRVMTDGSTSLPKELSSFGTVCQ